MARKSMDPLLHKLIETCYVYGYKTEEAKTLNPSISVTDLISMTHEYRLSTKMTENEIITLQLVYGNEVCLKAECDAAMIGQQDYHKLKWATKH